VDLALQGEEPWYKSMVVFPQARPHLLLRRDPKGADRKTRPHPFKWREDGEANGFSLSRSGPQAPRHGSGS
jgi:hypothetical protein